MKKLRKKDRDLDIKRNIKLRKKWKRIRRKKHGEVGGGNLIETNKWMEKKREEGLDYKIFGKNRVNIILPEKMNFSDNYEKTTLCLQAIRRLAKRPQNHKAYRLAKVDFQFLRKVSTSAGLVLTAELAKWENSQSMNLKPLLSSWDEEIIRRFYCLGFFDLFNCGISSDDVDSFSNGADLAIVKYIKRNQAGVSQVREFKKEIGKIIGSDINKWPILKCGLDEAINNVADHAYPEGAGFLDKEKNWYLTGSYNRKTSDLKVVFYDQGIGIPKSLPATKIKERLSEWLAKHHIGQGHRDEGLLRAAVEMDRTSTQEQDRGKGLPDMLEYVKENEDGYIAIMSGRGLYKFSKDSSYERVKTASFSNRIYGTLIIWKTRLAA